MTVYFMQVAQKYLHLFPMLIAEISLSTFFAICFEEIRKCSGSVNSLNALGLRLFSGRGRL